ncbi:hypothetical protein B6N58_02410 [Legionella micdadei]|nr:hypothetical protein B6N58_02410 [Legionella micdadei]ARG99365.1 hypothetical protein B6V88_02405 [Legionella micdadei]
MDDFQNRGSKRQANVVIKLPIYSMLKPEVGRSGVYDNIVSRWDPAMKLRVPPGAWMIMVNAYSLADWISVMIRKGRA